MKRNTATIRPATIDDALSIAELHVASWKVTYVGQIPEDYLAGLSVPTRENAWRDSLSNGNGTTLLSVEGDVIQGFVSFGASRDPDSSSRKLGEIYAIYIAPNCVGRGVGTLLWEAATGALKVRLFEELTVWVLDSNHAARGFYESVGCELDGGKKHETLGGQDVVEIRYRVSLR